MTFIKKRKQYSILYFFLLLAESGSIQAANLGQNQDYDVNILLNSNEFFNTEHVFGKTEKYFKLQKNTLTAGNSSRITESQLHHQPYLNRQRPISPGITHSIQRQEQNNTLHDRRRPISAAPNYNLLKQWVENPFYYLREPVKVDISHHLQASVKAGETHNRREPVRSDETRDSREPMKTDETHSRREPVRTDETHDSREPVKTDETHNNQKPVKTDETHNSRKPVKTDETHNSRKPVITDEAHNSRQPVETDISFNSRLPVVSHLIQHSSSDILSSTENIAANSSCNDTGNHENNNIPLLISFLESGYIHNGSVDEENLSHDLQKQTQTTNAYNNEVDHRVRDKVWQLVNQSISEQQSSVEQAIGATITCGISRSITARIVGGKVADYLRWPWMVSLRTREEKTSTHRCSAVVLNRLWVTTVAHCIYKFQPSDIILRLGDYNLQNTEELHPHVEMRVLLLILHPDFDSLTYENDIALLRFYHSSPIVENIFPVCLPSPSADFYGKTAVVTGWGRLYEDGELSDYLQEVHLSIIRHDDCQQMYYEAGYAETISDLFICGGFPSGGFDACEGDSGGPAVVRTDSGIWELAGLISWGIGCAKPMQPGVYVRVSKYVDWINNIIVI